MVNYYMTSGTFEGEIEFHFDYTETLSAIIFNATLKPSHYAFLFKHLPYTVERMETMIAEIKSDKNSATFTKQTKELTFEDFYNKYDEKALSSKKKTLIRWNNMTKAARVKAFMYINKYFQNLPSGTRKKYAETYLNSEIWEG